jgi:hypothetical protein
MRCLALLATALLLCVSAARADSISDLRQPSSTIPDCVNDWGPLGTSGVVQPTCERKVSLAEWNEHAAAVNTARDLLVQASHLPDRADPQAVVNALNACAAAADAMTRLYHPAEPRPRGLNDVLAWMRPWFERQRLAIPNSIAAGFRTLAGALGRPSILRQARIAIYQQAAVFATRESELAAELGSDVQRQTDAAVRAAHTAALKAAERSRTAGRNRIPTLLSRPLPDPATRPWGRSRRGSSTCRSPPIRTRMATPRGPAARSPPFLTPFCGSAASRCSRSLSGSGLSQCGSTRRAPSDSHCSS